jgi:acylphosphatase
MPGHAYFDHKRFNSLQGMDVDMALKKASIFVSGSVQMAGFRSFVKNLADSLDIKGYAENLPDGRVKIVCEGEEMGIAELANAIKTKAPALSKVESLQTEYEKYVGEFLDFERRGEDVPRRATLDDLLNVMKSFDNKAEKIVGILGEIGQNTSQIPAMREDISDIKSYTSQIPAMREDISDIKSYTSQIPAMKEDTAAIRADTREIATKLWEKYEELSKEIAQMKVTLAKIEAKVFA